MLASKFSCTLSRNMLCSCGADDSIFGFCGGGGLFVSYKQNTISLFIHIRLLPVACYLAFAQVPNTELFIYFNVLYTHVT